MMGESVFGWREEKKEWREPEPEYAPYKRYVEKQTLPVVVYTHHHRIEGDMHVTYHHRALDILNGPECYVPITSAKIYSIATGELVVEKEFVAVSKSHLILLYETGQPRWASEKNDSESGETAAGQAAEESSEESPSKP